MRKISELTAFVLNPAISVRLFNFVMIDCNRTQIERGFNQSSIATLFPSVVFEPVVRG